MGADDTLVALGEKVLRFLRADSGETVGDVTIQRQPPTPRPLMLDRQDHGKRIARTTPELDPTFAPDERTWAAAFPSGVVIAPADRDDDLDAALTWAIDRRFAWPVRWGGLTVVPDAPAAVDIVPEPLRKHLEPFRGRTMPGS